MHFFKTKTRLKKSRVTLATVAILSAAFCVGGELASSYPTISEIAFAAKKKSSKSKKKTTKTTKKKTKPTKKAKKVKQTKMHNKKATDTSSDKFKPFHYHEGGTKQVGSDYGNVYFQFHNAKSARAEGGVKSQWAEVQHYGSPTSKSKVFRYQVKGGTKNNPDSIKLPKNKRPSVYYTNVARAYFYPSDKGHTKKSVPVDIRATLVGYNESNPKDKHYIFIKKKSLGFSHSAAMGGVKAVYVFQFYNSKTKKPLNFDTTPLSFWDIDGGQGIGVSQVDGTAVKDITGKGEYGGHFPWIRPATSSIGRSKEMVFGTYGNHHGWKGQHALDHGNVDPDDVGGGITFMVPSKAGNAIEAQFAATPTLKNPNYGMAKGTVGGYNDVNYSAKASKINLSKEKGSYANTTKRSPKHVGTANTPGNLFTVNANVQSPPYQIKYRSDKQVKQSEPDKPKGWTEKLTLQNEFNPKKPDKTSYYYRVLASTAWPGSFKTYGKTKATAMQVMKQFTMKDREISPGLDIDTSWSKNVSKSFPVAFYTQNQADGKMTPIKKSEASAVFKVTKKKVAGGGTSLAVSLKKKKGITNKDIKGKNSKYKWLFNKNVSMVFKVKGNKQLASQFTKPLGNNKYEADLTNTAQVVQNGGTRNTNPTDVLLYITRKDVPAKVTPAKGYKDVYKLQAGKLGDDKNVNDSDWDWTSYNEGTVMPGQYLTYTLHFNLKKPKNTSDQYIRYTQLHLTDNLDEKIDHINNLYMGTSKRSKKYKIDIDEKPAGHKIDIKLKEDKYEELFKKLDREGGDLWFRYQAVLGGTKPSDGSEVVNQAQLEPTMKAVKRVHVRMKKTISDSKGDHTVTISVAHVLRNSKVSDDLNKWFGGNTGNDNEYNEKLNDHYTPLDDNKAEWGNMNAPKMPTAKTNKVTNPYDEGGPDHDVTKEYHDHLTEEGRKVLLSKLKSEGWNEKKDDSEFNSGSVTRDSNGEFTVKFNLGVVNSTVGDHLKGILFEDKVDQSFFSVKGFAITDPSGKDVTDLADFKSGDNSNDVRWQITDKDKLKKLDYETGGDYTMHIAVKSNMQKKATDKEFANTALVQYTEPDGPQNIKSNTVKLDSEDDDPDLSKGITKVQEWDPDTKQYVDYDSSLPLKANRQYKLHYRIDADLGNKYDLSNFTITDSLPEHTSLDTDSIQIATDKGQGDGEQDNYDNSLVDDLKTQTYSYGNNEDGFTITGGGDKFYYTNVHIEYDATVKPEADWSDYYNSSVNTQAGAAPGLISYNNGLHKVTDVSAIGVPNVVTLTTGDGDAQTAMAPFYVQAQTFKAEQYIVQDDDAWSFNLDPSHYLPHTRNDKTAVTTAVRVRMPNYLKINQVTFQNEAKSAGFDKGESHILRVNNKAARAPWGDPTKLGIPNLRIEERFSSTLK